MQGKQIKYFLEAAKFLHFSKAANSLGIAQSAISQQIMLLENELGCRLFDRSNKWKVSLTSAGKAFAEGAEKAQREFDKAKRDALRASKGEIGSLSIFSIPSFFSSEKFLSAIRKTNKKMPKVFLEMRKHSSANILERVGEQKLDVGIIRAIGELPPSVCEMTLGMEDIMLAIPSKHSLAAKSRIKIKDIINEKFIMVPFDESPFFYRTIERAFIEKCGSMPEISHEIYNFDAILKIIPETNFVAPVPSLLKNSAPKNVVLKKISDLEKTTRYTAVWHSENKSEALKMFLKILKDEFSTKTSK